jgi:mannose-6-phosphate isomerase-like protein (cupin superfamily)
MPFIDVAEHARFQPEKLAKNNLFTAPELFFDLYCLEPGQEQRPHVHADSVKIYYVREGIGVFRLGDEVRTLGPGAAAVAPAGEVHGVLNAGSERLQLLVVMAPNPGH